MVKAQNGEDYSQSYLFDEKAVKRFVKQMLRNHTFVGNYIEQRYVPDFKCYKKIVKISPKEDTFIENLSIVKRRIEKFYGNSKWVGITFPNTTGAPVGFNLWVEFDEDIFGTYKFRVKDVQFTDNQISLILQVKEPFDDTYSRRASTSNLSSQSTPNCSFNDEFNNLEIEKSDGPIFTWKNFKEASVFLILFITAMVTGGGQIIMFLMDYLLKFMRELSHIINASTPLFVACIEMIGKMFGYVCLLIALLFKKNPQVPQQPFYQQQIQYQPVYPFQGINRYKALPYPRNTGSSVKIVEVED